MLAFIVSAGIAQSIVFTGKSPQPLIQWQEGSVAGDVIPVDTLYSIHNKKPLRKIIYDYLSIEMAQMQCVKTELYNGKEWVFNSITVEPYSYNSAGAIYWTTTQKLLFIDGVYQRPYKTNTPQTTPTAVKKKQ